MFNLHNDAYHGNAVLKEDEHPYGAITMADNDNAMNIMLIEDNRNDMLLTMRTLRSTQIPHNMDVVTRGTEVIPYLRNCVKRLPDIVLLDMKLPGVDGFEILAMMAQASSRFNKIPIAIITGCEHYGYLQEAYPLPIVGYLTKPFKMQDMQKILGKIMPAA